MEQTFGAKPLRSISPHLLNQYRECLEACMEEADLEEYFSRGIGVRGHIHWCRLAWCASFRCTVACVPHHEGSLKRGQELLLKRRGGGGGALYMYGQ